MCCHVAIPLCVCVCVCGVILYFSFFTFKCHIFCSIILYVCMYLCNVFKLVYMCICSRIITPMVIAQTGVSTETLCGRWRQTRELTYSLLPARLFHKERELKEVCIDSYHSTIITIFITTPRLLSKSLLFLLKYLFCCYFFLPLYSLVGTGTCQTHYVHLYSYHFHEVDQALHWSSNDSSICTALNNSHAYLLTR